MKYVLVTGAYGGMGTAVVDMLKNKGYFVFAMDKRVGEKEQNVMPVQADITDTLSIQNAFEIIKSKTDKLYAIIHLAGIYDLDSLIEISEQRFTRAFEINVFGAYRINKVFRPMLFKNSRVVITTSELAPLAPLPFTSIYAITKTALDNYAYALNMELQLFDIHVSILRPGAVNTSLLKDSTDALSKFCENTKDYSVNAKKFREIVDKVEAKKIAPVKIANKILKIVKAKKPKIVYKINRNPLLLLLNVLPLRMQTWIIKKILKTKS